MTKMDTADRLCRLVCERFQNEQPERALLPYERNAIWFAIYGKLCANESEETVEEWCKTVTLYKRKIHSPIRCPW